MSIRPEETNDIETIRQITKAVFAVTEPGSQTEASIFDALREAGALSISLVAIQNNALVGHVAFSPVTIEDESRDWYGLGPVSVHPAHQNQGIGGQLIREGLSRLTKQGANGCVVVGEPDYYQRFGFEPDSSLHYEGVPDVYFMRLVFNGPTPTGRVEYHESFTTQS